jgi:glycosyltransferase involved in cell wall biosynthesis
VKAGSDVAPQRGSARAEKAVALSGRSREGDRWGGEFRVVVDGRIFSLQRHGGISRMFCELLPRVCELAPDLQITLMTTGVAGRLPVHERITVLRLLPVGRILRPGRFWLRAVSPVRLWLLARAARFDEWAIWQPTYGGIPKSWRGPKIAMVYDLTSELYQHLLRGAALRQTRAFNEQERAAVQRAQRVICISRSAARDAMSIYGVREDLCRVVPLAHSACFERRAVAPTRRPFLLYVGARYPYKNFSVVVAALPLLPADVDLVVVGPPMSRSEAALLRGLGVAERVEFRPGSTDDALCTLYNQASALVYPSFYEGFGIPLLEAMACGCPVVASRIPSSIEVAGECPYYFEPTSREDFVEVVSEALSRGRESARVNAAAVRAKEYSWDRSAAALLAVYRELAEGRNDERA